MAKAKTYYLGTTANGDHVGRACMCPYGYTHAAVRIPARFPMREHGGTKSYHMSDATFSTSSTGALNNASRNGWKAEVVTLKEVDRAAYKAAVGKA